jgi:RNA polymerase sigma-70 factor (ECF subfamily)
MVARAADSAETRRLLERARAGEPGAAGELLQRQRPYLLRLVELRMDPRLRPRADPSDVVQEAQMEATRRLEAYLEDPRMPFRLWLRQIAYDRLLMLQRRHIQAARRATGRELLLPEQSSLALAEQFLAAGPTPSEAVVRRELADRVRQALAQLPEGEREVLILRNLEGLSNQEVAEVLAVDPATCSRRYGRAVLRLREVLVQGGLKESE